MFSWLVFSILSFCVGVFLTGVQHLKLYSISRRNILKDNLTILHKSSSGHNRIRWCWNGLNEVTTKFRRYVIKMWIQNDVIQKHQYFSFIFNITPQSNDKWCTFSFSFLVIKIDFGKRCGSYLSNVPWYSYIPFWFKWQTTLMLMFINLLYLYKTILIGCEWSFFYFNYLFPIRVIMSNLTQTNALIIHCTDCPSLSDGIELVPLCVLWLLILHSLHWLK